MYSLLGMEFQFCEMKALCCGWMVGMAAQE